jgi:hypothetical protein
VSLVPVGERARHRPNAALTRRARPLPGESFVDGEGPEEAALTDTKHGKSESPFPDDLERNPGIGQSKGTFMTGEDPESIQGENTVEGDVDNDSTANDGVPEKERERTNR